MLRHRRRCSRGVAIAVAVVVVTSAKNCCVPSRDMPLFPASYCWQLSYLQVRHGNQKTSSKNRDSNNKKIKRSEPTSTFACTKSRLSPIVVLVPKVPSPTRTYATLPCSLSFRFAASLFEHGSAIKNSFLLPMLDQLFRAIFILRPSYILLKCLELSNLLNLS